METTPEMARAADALSLVMEYLTQRCPSTEAEWSRLIEYAADHHDDKVMLERGLAQLREVEVQHSMLTPGRSKAARAAREQLLQATQRLPWRACEPIMRDELEKRLGAVVHDCTSVLDQLARSRGRKIPESEKYKREVTSLRRRAQRSVLTRAAVTAVERTFERVLGEFLAGRRSQMEVYDRVVSFIEALDDDP